jgi:hypothetical protein
MALFGNMFKKKEAENLNTGNAGTNTMQGLGSETGLDLDSGLKLNSLNPQPFTENPNFDSFGNPKKDRSYEREYNQPQQNMPNQDVSKDMQIVLAKLDAIKAHIDNIDRRMELMERQQSTQKKYTW